MPRGLGLDVGSFCCLYNAQFLTELGETPQQPVNLTGNHELFGSAESRNDFLPDLIALPVGSNDLEVLVPVASLDTTLLSYKHEHKVHGGVTSVKPLLHDLRIF